MSGSHLSKEFFDLVKSIGESRSKQEEDKIIVQEVATLKAKMSAREVPARKMKEYLIRMLYVEMLGHDASFGHIHGIKMAHSRSLLEKRVGYLAVSLTLHKEHSFLLLLINTLQQDLKSDNYLECSMALTVVAKLVNTETIPAILPLVVKLLDHKEGSCKKKAVMCLHRFHQLDPSSIASLGAPIRKALCDSNISVMAASLNLFLDLCAHKASAYKDLVPDFVSILKQVIEHRLPRDYDYHRCPAPWVQLKLLQILAVLGVADKNASEGMYEILREVMKRADIGINVGYAIVYECVRTVTSIYPDPSLIEDAASSISRFVTSDNHNLKYLGVNALAAIVQIDSKYAAEHQLVVIDCLEDPDETLKRKTLDLLYSMTNPQNVTVIVAKLTQYLQSASDQYLRSELVSRINQLAEKYAPNNQWFINTMNNVFELSGNPSVAVSSSMSLTTAGAGSSSSSASSMSSSEKLIKNEMATSILRLISEQAQELQENYNLAAGGSVPEGEEDIRVFAADTYIALLTAKRNKSYSNNLPDILLQVCAWVLGEYGNLSSTTAPADVLQLLVSLLERQVDSPAVTKSWILAAIVKMAAKIAAAPGAAGKMPPHVVEVVSKYENSLFVDLQQRAFEFAQLIQSPRTLTAVLPPTNTFDLELHMDDSLSFLDSYVATALANGAKPYNSDPAAKARMAEASAADNAYSAGGSHGSKGLKFQAYAAPEREIASPPQHHAAPATAHGNGANLYDAYAGGHAQQPAAAPADDSLRLNNVVRRWGPSGYNDPDAVAPAAAAAPVAQPAAAHHGQATMAAMPSQAQLAAQAAAARQAEEDAARQRAKEAKAREIAARPRELTEREKMANSLFAGVGAAAPAPSPAARRPIAAAVPVARPIAQQQAQAAPVAAASTDFLGGLMDSVPVAQPVAQQAAKPAGGAPDLLDLFGGGSVATSSPAKPTATAASSSSGGNFMDMMGGDLIGGGGSSSSSGGGLFDGVQQRPAAAPQHSTDPFGFHTSAPASSNGGEGDLFSSLGEGSTKFGLAGCSPQVAGQLSALRAGPENILVSDARVQVSLVKAAAPDAAVLALFVSNKSGAALQNVQLQFSLPQGLAVHFRGDAAAQAQQGSAPGQHVIVIASLNARQTVAQLASLTVRDLSAFSASAGGLALSNGAFSFSGLSAPLSFRADLSVTDFLRPAVGMRTEQYGAAWKQLSDEVKAQARPTTCTTPADFMARMGAHMGLHGVQTIGTENICAGRLVVAAGGSVQQTAALVLVHGKVHSHIDLIVKAKSRDLAQLVAKQLAVVLK